MYYSKRQEEIYVDTRTDKHIRHNMNNRFQMEMDCIRSMINRQPMDKCWNRDLELTKETQKKVTDEMEK